MTVEREECPYIQNRARFFEAALEAIGRVESADIRGSTPSGIDVFGIKMAVLGIYKDLVGVGKRGLAREIMRKNGFLKAARDKV